jgi:hypothetical protein
MTDYAPLLDPRPDPPQWAVVTSDALSWALPVIAAGASIVAGIEALNGADRIAAMLAIGAGVASALGVVVTNWSSRIRDRRLERAMALAGIAMDTVEFANRRQPGHW